MRQPRVFAHLECPALTIDGIGEVLAWGEFWLLTYADCGHVTMFPRTGHQVYEPADVEHQLRTHHAECPACARFRAGQN